MCETRQLMASIKRISKCFQEVKRLTGDLLPEEKIDEILFKAKQKINENKFQQQQSKTDKLLAEEIINEFEYDQAIKKRNLAENNIKALDQYERILDAIEISKGKLSPRQAVKAMLVGVQEFSNITRNSIGAKQDTIEVVEAQRLYNAMKSEGVWDAFDSGKMDLDIKREILGVDTGLQEAKVIAKILQKFQNDWRIRLNDLGANIGELRDWITRQHHDTDKMANASRHSKIVGDNRFAWVEYIRERLDLARTFPEVSKREDIDRILGEVYDSLMSSDHLKHGGTNSIYGTRNVANRLNASRVLHFKSADARHEYDLAFGSPSLKESVLGVLTHSARNIGIMQDLGTNPRQTFEKVISLLRKKYKTTNPKEARNLRFEEFKNEFYEIDGTVNGIANHTLAKVSMATRFFQSTGKLGFATVSSMGDLGQYMLTSRFQGRGMLYGLWEALGALFRTQDKQALEVLDITSNSIIATNGHKYGLRDETWGALGKVQNTFFKWNSLNRWVSSLKSGMTVGLARHYGMLKGSQWKNLKLRERNLLTLYGIDEGKWDMLRSIETLDVDGKSYMTVEAIQSLSDESVVKYVGRKLSQREIKNWKRDLEMTWRNFLVDQALHGTPEPDAAVRAFMNRGLQKGTPEGELIRFIMQFKAFPISIWKKIIGRELRSYGHDESKMNMIGGFASMVMLSTIFGYLAMSAKDMLKGRSPRDPEKIGTIMAAFHQGGGLGIYGDFLYGELQNEYGGGIFETALGPTAADVKKVIDLPFALAKDPKKAGKKLLQLAEGNIPFLNLYYTKAAYDYLIGYQMKEYLDPGYFDRISERHKEKRGQTYYLKP